MSELTDAVARARRDLARAESPLRTRLRDAYARAVESLSDDLEAIGRQIEQARRMGIDVNPDWLRRQARYRTLIAQAEAQFARFSAEGVRIVREGRVAAVSGGAASAVELAAAAGVATGVTFGANINTGAVERLGAALSDDSPVKEVLDGYGPRAARVIEQHLLVGMIEGTGPRQIVRGIRRALNGRGNRARLDALVRSELMRAFESTLFDTYRQMGVERWVWMAALSSRTCLACLAMHGSVHPMSKAFMRRHICCRCIPAPWTPAVTVERGAAWFARQPEKVQRAMLPSRDAFAAYRAREGALPLSAFVGRRQSRTWGESVFERSGREALRKAA